MLGGLAALADHRDRLAQTHHRARRHEDLEERSAIEGAKLHRRFVGFDLREKFIDLDSVALLLVPGDDLALFHRGRELRHVDDSSHFNPSGR